MMKLSGAGRLIGVFAATLLAGTAAAAQAQSNIATCGVGGGFCATENTVPTAGNSGAVAEALIFSTAPGLAISRPSAVDRSVFVNQVGTDNAVTVTQTARAATALIAQHGERNSALVDQHGEAVGYAHIAQQGIANQLTAGQEGVGGANILQLVQSGTGNILHAAQRADVGADNGAAVTQTGIFNMMSLDQSGSDNLAQLTQQGDDNRMTATQSGVGNRLVWTQQGDNLSNLAITQSGGQSLQVMQSR